MTTMRQGRQDGTDRRRQRVAGALKAAAQKGSPVSVSGIARQAGVDRTFLYRHRDLLALVHAAELQPATQDPAGATPCQPCLAPGRPRQRAGTQHPARHPRPAVGEASVRGAGGTGLARVRPWCPADVEELQRTITRLEQQTVDLKASLEEREAELEAAREANRQLTRALNKRE